MMSRHSRHGRSRLSDGLAIPCVLSLFSLTATTPAADNVPLADGLNNPESAVAGADGRIYVTLTGKPNVDDGAVAVVAFGKATIFATGMSDPRGIARKGDIFFVADLTKVWTIDSKGKATIFANTDAFPVKPRFLNDVEVGSGGDVFVSDSGSFIGNGAVFRITSEGKVSVVLDANSAPPLKAANGLLADGADHLFVADVVTGKLFRAKLADGTIEPFASGLGASDGIAQDAKGLLYIGDVRVGRVFRIDGPGAKPTLFAEGLQSAADIALDGEGRILVPDSRAGTLTAIPIGD